MMIPNSLFTPKAKCISARDVFCVIYVNKNIIMLSLHFFRTTGHVKADVSLSSSLIDLRDNASCEFPARVEFFSTCVEDAIEANITCSQMCCPICHVIVHKFAAICVFAFNFFLSLKKLVKLAVFQRQSPCGQICITVCFLSTCCPIEIKA